MPENNSFLLLKIFSGLHAGAELPLNDGEYHIGGEEECDIILNDCATEGQQVHLKIDGDQLFIRDINGTFYIDGELANGDEKQFYFFQIITLGSVHLAIGPKNEIWPKFQAPEIITDIEAENPSESGQMTSGRNAQSPAALEENDLQDGKHSLSKIFKRPGFLIYTAASVTLFAFLFYFNIQSVTAPQPNISLEQAQAKIKEVLEINMVSDPLVELDANRKIFTVSGYTQDKTEIKNLCETLDTIPYEIIWRITTINEILNAFNSVLDNHGVQLEATHNGEGNFAVHGFLKDKDLLRTIMHRLNQDLPAVKNIDFQVQTYEEFIPEVFNELERQGGLNGSLDLLVHRDYIRVEGEFKDGDRNIWNKVKSEISNRFGPQIRFKEFYSILPKQIELPPPSEPKNDYLALSKMLQGKIAGITLGRQRYIITKDGKKCFEGGMLTKGHTIRTIWQDHIVLNKNGQDITIPLEVVSMTSNDFPNSFSVPQ